MIYVLVFNYDRWKRNHSPCVVLRLCSRLLRSVYLCRGNSAPLGWYQIGRTETPPVAATIPPLLLTYGRIVGIAMSGGGCKAHAPQTMSNKWSQSCNTAGSDTDAGLDRTPDSDVGGRIQEVRSVHECVYVEHPHYSRRAADRCKGQDASNKCFRLQFHLQVPDNEERQSTEDPICSSVDSCKRVCNPFRGAC